MKTVSLPRPLQLPNAPVPVIAEPEALLHRERATGAIWHLAGRRTQLKASGLNGVEGMDADGQSALGPLSLVGLTGANLSIAPRGYRRECFLGAASVMERVVVPEMLPGIVVQWDFRSASVRPDQVTVRATLLPAAVRTDPLHDGTEVTGIDGAGADDPGADTGTEGGVHTDSGVLWVARGDQGVLLTVPAPTHDSDTPPAQATAGPTAVLVEWVLDVPEDGVLTLLVQGAPPERRWTSPRALAGVDAHHTRGEAAAVGRDEPGIRPGTGVDEMDEGIARARTWVRHRLLARPGSPRSVHTPPPVSYVPSLSGEPLTNETWETPASFWTAPGTEAAWIAMAAAAAGEWEASEGALDRLSWEGAHQRLTAFQALANFVLWTGEAAPLKARADLLSALSEDTEWYAGVAPSAFAGVRDALASAAEAAELKDLHELVKGMPLPVQADGGGGGGRRLPMAGGGGAAPEAALKLPALLRLGRHGISPRARLKEAALLRSLLGEIAADPSQVGSGSGASALVHLVHGMLGAVPDAVFGRLDLSPLFPGNWTGFRISGLRAGEGTLAVSYQRTGDTARWEIAPELGSVPITVNFEPWFPFPSVGRALVDGQEAELESVSVDGWTRVKVQVPADGVRTLVVESGAPLDQGA